MTNDPDVKKEAIKIVSSFYKCMCSIDTCNNESTKYDKSISLSLILVNEYIINHHKEFWIDVKDYIEHYIDKNEIISQDVII